MNNKKIGIIGCGNLANAFIEGMYNKNAQVNSVYVYDHNKSKMDLLHESFGVNTTDSVQELFKQSHMIILMVKPQNFDQLTEEIIPLIEEHLIVSVMAGLTIERLYKTLGQHIQLIRTMPNTPASVNEGITGVILGRDISTENKQLFEEVFYNFGMISYIDEKELDAFTAICGSSPAFVYMFIQGMIEGGIQAGLKPEIVPKMVAQAVLGAAKMVRDTGVDAVTLRENVTSKGGITFKGVESLQQSNLEGIVTKAIIDTKNRSLELNKEMSKK